MPIATSKTPQGWRGYSGMQRPERVSFLFADARELYADALEQLELGKPRNAAEKAWGATKRATDALIVARTGHEPGNPGRTRRELSRLGRLDPAVDSLFQRYDDRQRFLHGKCFYRGECAPAEEVIAEIQATADYIQAAERLAGGIAEC